MRAYERGGSDRQRPGVFCTLEWGDSDRQRPGEFCTLSPMGHICFQPHLNTMASRGGYVRQGVRREKFPARRRSSGNDSDGGGVMSAELSGLRHT